jgi:hypothetical protein
VISKGLYIHRTAQDRGTKTNIHAPYQDSNPRFQQLSGDDLRLRWPPGSAIRGYTPLYPRTLASKKTNKLDIYSMSVTRRGPPKSKRRKWQKTQSYTQSVTLCVPKTTPLRPVSAAKFRHIAEGYNSYCAEVRTCFGERSPQLLLVM